MDTTEILDGDLKKDHFMSNEEWQFYNWCLEAIEIGIVQNIKYTPWTIQLAKKEHTKIPAPIKKDPKRERKFVLFQPCTYTPDFILQVQPMNNPLINQNVIPIMGLTHPSKPKDIYRYLPSYLGDVIIVDVKGTYSLKHKSDQTFFIIRKWLYYHSGMYVNKIVPKRFFKKTWCPEVCKYTEKTNVLSKAWIGYPTRDEYMEKNKVLDITIDKNVTQKFIQDTIINEKKNENVIN